MSPSILRTTPRSRSSPSSLLVPCALVGPTETVVSHPSLPLMNSEIASWLNVEQARGTASTTSQAQATATQSAGIGNANKRSSSLCLLDMSYEKDIADFLPRDFPSVGQDGRTSNGENEYFWWKRSLIVLFVKCSSWAYRDNLAFWVWGK